MVATSGDRLIDEDAVDAVRADLLPLADLVTPNVPEAAVLLDADPAGDLDGLIAQATALRTLGPAAVLLKGGHLGGEESLDVLATADGVVVTRRPRVATTSTHGTGCTLSSALAALAARERVAGRPVEWPYLVEAARDYLQRALQAGAALGVGSGHGPVHHFAGVWPA
jgi:hydroxymethylpyrimidine/phosphomethylpyrimidine kinase